MRLTFRTRKLLKKRGYDSIFQVFGCEASGLVWCSYFTSKEVALDYASFLHSRGIYSSSVKEVKL